MKADVQLKLGYLLCLVGIYLTAMLSFSDIFRVFLPCGQSNGCGIVALSPASHIGSIPVPVLGLLYFVALASITANSVVSKGETRPNILFGISILGAAISTVYTIYSIAILRAECVWCIASNFVACLLALLCAFDRAHPRGEYSGRKHLWFLLAPALCVTVLIAATTRSTYFRSHRFPWKPEALARVSLEEMSPPDSVVLDGNPSGPTVVFFLDFQCPACEQAFSTAYRVAAQDRVRLAVRNLPHPLHPASRPLAVMYEVATQRGLGVRFLLGALNEGLDTAPKGRALLASLKATPSFEFQRTARIRVDRDKRLALKIGLSETPSIFVISPGRPAVPATADSLAEVLKAW